jgi:hypothetical protein
MKNIIRRHQISIATLILFLCSVSPAKDGKIPTEADYVVPTTADLVKFSRFKIKISVPYEGQSTSVISYVFPPELTGTPNKVVTLTRDSFDKNTWSSDEMTASCTESGELFSCNIYLKKEVAPIVVPENVIKNAFTSLTQSQFQCGGKSSLAFASAGIKNVNNSFFTSAFIDSANVENFLKDSGVTGEELTQRMAVAQAFACSEPAGFLSYEFL